MQWHLKGTTLVEIATGGAFVSYKKAKAIGDILGKAFNLVKVTSTQYANLKSVFIKVTA